jgi:hypothetical protein
MLVVKRFPWFGISEERSSSVAFGIGETWRKVVLFKVERHSNSIRLLKAKTVVVRVIVGPFEQSSLAGTEGQVGVQLVIVDRIAGLAWRISSILTMIDGILSWVHLSHKPFLCSFVFHQPHQITHPNLALNHRLQDLPESRPVAILARIVHLRIKDLPENLAHSRDDGQFATKVVSEIVIPVD